MHSGPFFSMSSASFGSIADAAADDDATAATAAVACTLIRLNQFDLMRVVRVALN